MDGGEKNALVSKREGPTMAEKRGPGGGGKNGEKKGGKGHQTREKTWNPKKGEGKKGKKKKGGGGPQACVGWGPAGGPRAGGAAPNAHSILRGGDLVGKNKSRGFNKKAWAGKKRNLGFPYREGGEKGQKGALPRGREKKKKKKKKKYKKRKNKGGAFGPKSQKHG